MALNEVLSVKNGQALILTFNRPDQKNALTLDMASQAFTILKNATTDRSVRAVMLNGAGGHFMDGLDMDIFRGDLSKGLERANQIIAPYHSAIRELQAMDKPVVAAVEGLVTGAGLSFMLACDFVVAARSTRFSCGYTQRAMSPDGGCSYFLPRRVGVGKAMELMMLSKEFDVVAAEKMGLVTTVSDDDKLRDESISFLTDLAKGPTRAYGAVKKLVLRTFDQDMNAHLGLEHTFWGQSMRSFDFKDYLRAWASHRDPEFSGI
jgi:2-(1,2-epoxy-1,2-dihydrophenyl)acetyl-CoA isomerase